MEFSGWRPRLGGYSSDEKFIDRNEFCISTAMVFILQSFVQRRSSCASERHQLLGYLSLQCTAVELGFKTCFLV